MKITKTWLKNRDACEDGYEWFLEQKTTDFETLFHLAMKAGRYPDINWVITKKMNKKQRVQYAIYSAELVLKNFESKYPNDDRPRKAIEAAKEYLKHPSESAWSAAGSAESAAWGAARRAAGRAEMSAASAAASAASAAASAARAEMSAARNAAWRAARSAAARAEMSAAARAARSAASAAWRAAWNDIYKDIVTFGFNLLNN